MNKIKKIAFLVFLIIFIFLINYLWVDKLLAQNFSEFSDKTETFVQKVIDGDTIRTTDGTVRLLGINSPERNEDYYSGAKKFLEDLILNKTVELKFSGDRKDMYDRTLAYVFFENKNIGLILVEQGFANNYFPSTKDNFYKDFKQAWENCIASGKNLCGKSKNICTNCIILKKFDYKNQEIKFYNQCDFACELENWEIKDEGRKKFIFPKFSLNPKKSVVVRVGKGYKNNENLFWENEDYVWTNSGDTLFLRDGDGKLVLWESY